MPDEPDGQNQLPKTDDNASRHNEKTSDTPNKTKKKSCVSPRALRCITLIFDGLLVFVGAVYSFFAYQQWQSMNMQIRIANKALHIEQRAWVTESDISGKAQEGQVYKIAVTFKNTGKTPAKQHPGLSASCFRLKEIADPDPDWDTEVAKEAAGNIFTKGLIPPNGAFAHNLNASHDAKMAADDIPKISNPTLVMLVFGKIIYWDIFGCEHWSTYCYRAYPDGTFIQYGPYNDSDENECF